MDVSIMEADKIFFCKCRQSTRLQCLVNKIKTGENLNDQRGKHINSSKKLKITDEAQICDILETFHTRKIIIAELPCS